MQVSAAAMRSLAVVAIIAFTVSTPTDAEKVRPCCVTVSRILVKEPIIDFILLLKNPPCVKAIMIVTAEKMYCIDPKWSVARNQINEFVKSKQKNHTSVEKDQVIEKIFTCINKNQTDEKTLTCTEKAQGIEKDLMPTEKDQDEEKTFTCIQMKQATEKKLTTPATDQDLEKDQKVTSSNAVIEPEVSTFCTDTRVLGPEED